MFKPPEIFIHRFGIHSEPKSGIPACSRRKDWHSMASHLYPNRTPNCQAIVRNAEKRPGADIRLRENQLYVVRKRAYTTADSYGVTQLTCVSFILQLPYQVRMQFDDPVDLYIPARNFNCSEQPALVIFKQPLSIKECRIPEDMREND